MSGFKNDIGDNSSGGITNDLELKLEHPGLGSSSMFESENKSLKGKRLLVIGGSVLIFVIIAYLLMNALSHDSNKPVSGVSKNEKVATQNYSSVLLDFPEIITNLSPVNDKESYIKLVIALELNDSKDQDAIDKKIYMLKDTIIIFLRELRANDLTSSGGSMMLREEIIKRVNKVIYPVEIKDVLFKEIFVNQ